MKYILIILFVGMYGFYASAQTADDYCNVGIEKFNQHNYGGALTEFDKAIALNPNSSRAYNNRGIIKSITNDITGAIVDYDKAITLEPNNSSAYKNRAQLQMRLKNYSAALADYNKVLEFNAQDEAALKNVKELKRLLKAASQNETFVEKQNKDSIPTTLATVVKPVKEKHSDKAVKIIKAEEHKAPAHLPIDNKKQKTQLSAQDYLSRGRSRVEASDYKGAIDDYNKAIALDSANASAYYHRGLLKATLRNYKGEQKASEEDIKLSYEKKKEDVLLKRELLKGDFGAIEDYTKAIQLNPSYADAYYGRAMSFYYLKEYRNAIANYTEVITLNKNFADAYYYRGISKGILADMSSACMDFRKAAELGSAEAKDLLNDCK